MAEVKFTRKSKIEIDSTPVEDGQILFSTDTPEIFMDDGEERKEYGGSSGDVSTEIDDTLTQSGKAADAKVTGDKLNEKVNKTGWTANKFLGTDGEGNVIEKEEPTGGGTGGTTDYNDLSNKPQLNGVTLEGNKTLDQVGVLAKNQGSSNSGKYLSVGSDGNVVPADAPSGGSVDPEQIKQAVNDYLEENPVSGMTATVKNAFLECFANVAWATAEGQACYDKLKTALNESVGEIKLSSITATCSETAQIGTAASDLDIVVTAIYSDGSSAQVTGWTTSGTVVEGTNTFVVSYGGKNTTVTVTGVDLYYVLNKVSNKSEIMSSNSYSDGGETGAGFPDVYLAWHLWGSKVVEQDTAVKIKYVPSENNYNGVFAYCINPETFTIDRKKYYAVQLTAHALVDTSYEWEYTIKAGYAFGISLGSNSPVPTVEVVS